MASFVQCSGHTHACGRHVACTVQVSERNGICRPCKEAEARERGSERWGEAQCWCKGCSQCQKWPGDTYCYQAIGSSKRNKAAHDNSSCVFCFEELKEALVDQVKKDESKRQADEESKEDNVVAGCLCDGCENCAPTGCEMPRASKKRHWNRWSHGLCFYCTEGSSASFTPEATAEIAGFKAHVESSSCCTCQGCSKCENYLELGFGMVDNKRCSRVISKRHRTRHHKGICTECVEYQ